MELQLAPLHLPLAELYVYTQSLAAVLPVGKEVERDHVSRTLEKRNETIFALILSDKVLFSLS